MSYSSRKRYKSRRDRNKKAARNFRLILIGIVILAAFLIIQNWQDIVDYWKTYTY